MTYKNRVLVVVEPEICELLEAVLKGEGCAVTSVSDGQQALTVFEAESFPIVLLDIFMQGIDGLTVLQKMRAQCPDTKVIILTAHASLDSAIEALREGVFDYICKGPRIWDDIVLKVQRALGILSLNRQLVGDSSVMQELDRFITQVATTDTTILIRGETGTGKELVANAIHIHSMRKAKSFVVIDANIPEALAEAELFGVTSNYPGLHRQEALTGQFVLADGGTLFLDEIGDLPIGVQPKLLRALQERKVRPLGAPHTVQVDVRVIAATNRDLEAAMRNGQFRADLYHRLNVVTIEVPPLRDRKDDIPKLVQHFLTKTCERLKRPFTRISDEALQILLAYDYPGNVRELENLIDRAVILTSNHIIMPEVLPINLNQTFTSDLMQNLPHLTLSEAHGILEKTYLELQLQQTRGNISQAARRAGIDRKNFKQKLKKYGITIGFMEDYKR